MAQSRLSIVHASAFIIGLIFAVGGAASIAGSLLAPFIQKHLTVGQAILATRWTFALLWALYFIAPYPLILGATEIGFGFADPIEDVPYFSYRLALIPDELKGRVISACRLFSGTMRPLGLALTGLLLQHLGAAPTALITWGYLLALTLLMTFSSHIRNAGQVT